MPWSLLNPSRFASVGRAFAEIALRKLYSAGARLEQSTRLSGVSGKLPSQYHRVDGVNKHPTLWSAPQARVSFEHRAKQRGSRSPASDDEDCIDLTDRDAAIETGAFESVLLPEVGGASDRLKRIHDCALRMPEIGSTPCNSCEMVRRLQRTLDRFLQGRHCLTGIWTVIRWLRFQMSSLSCSPRSDGYKSCDCDA